MQRTKTLNAALNLAERHLRLVFHRYLSGDAADISIYLNNLKLEPIDPFAGGHPARQVEPKEVLRLPNGLVSFNCVTLPHHQKMTPQEWDEIGGPEGHLRSQGLYVYRADRLIIAGGWLGLARQTEATKLCRVAVDIPNSMDSEWKIDVKKASAQLPPVVRAKLKNIVDRFASTSKRTYTRRGRKLISPEQHPIWNRLVHDKKIVFKPDLLHPVFVAFRNKLPSELQSEFDACIKLTGSSLPLETLHSDMLGGAENIESDYIDDNSLDLQVTAMIDNLRSGGVESQIIPDLLRNVATLKANWERAKDLIDKYLKDADENE